MAGRTGTPLLFDDQEKLLFLMELKASCNITVSAEKIGFTRQCMYDHKKKDKLFSDAWDNALDEGIDLLEKKAQDRAFNGVEKKIFFKGEKVDTQVEYSDGLTTFLLRAHRPEKYAKEAAVNINTPAGVIVVPEGMKSEEWVKKHGDSLSKET
jgi:hypothetical protein